MIKPIQLRNIVLGEGMPKLIVPIVDRTRDAILEKVSSFEGRRVDLIEWRVDFFDQADDMAAVNGVLQALRQALPEMPILFTFRTKKEGGEREISMPDYIALNRSAAQSGCADLIDVEIFSGDEVVRELIDAAHAAGVRVVGSNHDFFQTPEKEELVRRLRKMQEMEADIPKIAVMPNSAADVLTLLSATDEMYTQYADRPLITMSMRGLGTISRMAGEIFGSAATFGTVGQESAPGQISVEHLAAALEYLHQAKG